MRLSLDLTLAFILAFSLFGSIARADSAKNSDPYKVGIKKPKTGGFVGGEIGFGGAYTWIDAYIYNAQGQYQGNYWGSSDHTAIPLNVFGGYQWYFYDRPWFHFGVRVRGHIGYTNYNTEVANYRWAYGNNVTLSISSHAIQYGAEAQFLWDFLNMGKHTLGWHISPVGLEGSTFFGSVTATGGGNNFGTISNDLKIATKFSYIFSTGFHYYYNARHIVFATYKSRYYNNSYNAVSGTNTIYYYTYANNLLMLGYAYKF